MRRIGPVTMLAVVAAAMSPASAARAAPSRLSDIAARGVLAVSTQGSADQTAFVFERESSTLTARVTTSGVRLIASNGASISAEAHAVNGFATIAASGLGLGPLRPSGLKTVRPSTVLFVLGPPLGYEAERIRRVALPQLRVKAARAVSVHGSLPKSFAGAPVVTEGGRVVGAVAAVASSHWRFAPLGELDAIVSPPHTGSSGGPPLLSLLLAALVLFLGGAAFGVLRAKRRRERELEANLRRARGARAQAREDQTDQQPLVRFRGSSEGESTQELSVPPAEEEDFDVIIKPQRDS
ncbi:MAG: hypothetical protein ACYDC2_02380 [Solirubrobacteraceae bacterium]